ncbi:MAG: GerAB/ArcD/ProY family transporter [Limnochordaceae bacterium]|nr:GerAB/ArcD/ProY family transporter [Limnochordaceae bacterium]
MRDNCARPRGSTWKGEIRLQTSRITPRQILFLAMGTLTGTSTLLLPAPVAGSDQWLAILMGAALGLALTFVYQSLWKALRRVQGENLPHTAATQPAPVNPGMFVRAAGPAWGRILAFLYWGFFTHLAALVLRNLVTSIGSEVLPRTPTPVLVTAFLALAVWSASQGTEGVARLAEAIIPMTYLASFVIIGLSIITPHLVDLRRLLPAFDRSWQPVVQGSWEAFTFPFAELVALLPFGLASRPPERTAAMVRRGIVLTAVMLMLMAARTLAALGPAEVSRYVFPGFIATELIEVGGFVERIDAVALFIWINAGFVKLTLTLLAAAQSLFDLLGLERREETTPLLLSLGLVVGALTTGLYSSPVDMVIFAKCTYPVYAPVFEVLGPFLLLTLARRRNLSAQPVTPQRE